MTTEGVDPNDIYHNGSWYNRNGSDTDTLLGDSAVNVLAFGAVAGATDNYAAIQAAIDSLSTTGGTVLIPPGTFNILTGLTSYANVGIYLADGAILDMSGCAANAIGITWEGTEGTAYNLTANATISTTSATISAANLVSSGIVAGDWVRIGSTAVFDSLRTSSKIGELIRVSAVDTGTGVITFHTALRDTYNTADTGTVSKINFLSGAALIGNGTIQGRAVANDGHEAVRFFKCYAPTVSGNIKIKKMSDRGIALRDSIFFNLSGMYFEGFVTNTTGYGVVTENACQDGLVTNFSGRGCRHLFTTDNSSAVKGICRRIRFDNWIITNSATDGSAVGGDSADTHAAAEDIHISNGIVHSSSGLGVNMECRSGSLTNITVYTSASKGVHIHNETDRAGDWVLENVHSYSSVGEGVYVSAGISATSSTYERLIINNCGGIDSSTYGVRVLGAAAAPITNLVMTGISSKRAGSTTADIRVDNVVGGCIGNSSGSDNANVAVSSLKVTDCKDFNVNNYHADLPSSSTGSGVYVDASGAGTTDRVTVDGVIVSSPSASSSRGLRVSNNAVNVTAGASNDFRACTTPISWGTGTGHRGGYLTGSATYDPPSLADGVGATTTVTVTGAALGDSVIVGFSLDLQGITLTGYVSAANTVSCRFQNESGGVLDIASGTLRATVIKLG